MVPLQVTAWTSSAIAAYDDWTPDLGSLLTYVLLNRAGRASPNPTAEDVAKNMAWVRERLPVATLFLNNNPDLWYRATSSPCYRILNERIDRFRKRWDVAEIGRIDWGKRKPKVNTSEGSEKSYDLPLPLRGVDRIDWWCLGNRDGILDLLQDVSYLGKKRRSRVSRWEVTEVENDYHLYRGDVLMRPIPLNELRDGAIEKAVRLWGWRDPVWLTENRTVCAMPVATVLKDYAALR